MGDGFRNIKAVNHISPDSGPRSTPDISDNIAVVQRQANGRIIPNA